MSDIVEITTVDYDINGHHRFVGVSQNDDMDLIARVAKTDTLDLGVSIDDQGSTAKDRLFSFPVRLKSDEQRLILRDLFNNHSQFIVCTVEGGFLCVRTRWILRRGSESVLNFFIQEAYS